MFSRAAKSVVKSLRSRRIHIGEKSFKIALIGGAGEISQTLSQLLKNSAKLNALALYDVAAVNRPLPNYNFHAEEPFKPIPSETLTMAKKSCSGGGSRSNAVIRASQTNNNNHEENNGRSQIEKLVEALYRLPIAEGAATFNNPLIPIEEIMPKLQPKEENLTVRLQDSGIDKRRERSSSPMKSTVEIAESGKPIESNQIQTNKGSLSVTNSRQQFMGINNLHQDSNLAIDHKDRSDFSFLHKHFVSNLRHCSDREFDESKLSHDRQGNDDYFPQGEEYEEEIGTEDYQLGKKTPSKKPSRLEDEHEKFEPTMLMFENNKYINGGPLTRYITHVYFSSIEELTDADRTMLMSKKVSNKDAVEKLQTLIEKVTEFKRRVFRSKHDAPKTEATTDGKKERKIANENNESTNRFCFISQKISKSAY